MSNLLKDIYSPAFFARFADVLNQTLPTFDKKKFLCSFIGDAWQQKELKERMRHTSTVLHKFLPDDFAASTEIIERTIKKLRQNPITESSFEFMFFPDYIEIYGIDDFETSVKAIEFTTQFVSCEFAVRPFILKYGDRMIARMQQWSLHSSHKVRRLSSEGIRPRLPWAMALPALKRDPTPILPILENLKGDESEFVRRSVANNLNDIAKDNPAIVLSIAKNWKGLSEETDKILKHGCRTLLKAGHPQVLKHFGYYGNKISIASFKIITPKVKLGQSLKFSVGLKNDSKKTEIARLEYGLYYKRLNGRLAKKVFKISERKLLPGEKIVIERRQNFKTITTRKFYPGRHQLSIIINGKEIEMKSFELQA